MDVKDITVLIASVDSADFADYIGFSFLLCISMYVLLKPVHSQVVGLLFRVYGSCTPLREPTYKLPIYS